MRRLFARTARRSLIQLTGSFAWASDPNILSWREADSGLGDKIANNPWGAFTQPGGAVPIASGGANGQLEWQFTKGSGKYLLAAGADLNLRYYPPFHLFVIVKSTGTPSAGDAWLGNPLNGNPRLCWQASTTARITSNSSVDITGITTANYNLYDIYFHSGFSRRSVNGAAYTTIDTTIGSAMDGLVLGAGNSAGGVSSSCAIPFIMIVEGQASATLKAGLFAYLNAKYGMGLPAPPATFSIAAADPSALFTPPFDIVVGGGASNNGNYSQVATAAFNPNIYIFGNDNVYKTAPALYDVNTNQMDVISADTPSSPAGGNASSLCNSLQAAWGRPLVYIPCMTGSSYVVPGTTMPPQHFTWEQSYLLGSRPVGATGVRNTIFNSAVERVKDAIAKGGTYRFMWWYGDGEALVAQQFGDLWPTYAPQTWDAFHARIGQTKRVVYVQMALTTHGTNWANFRANTQPLVQTSQQIMVSAPDGPYNGDGLGHLQGTACDTIGAAGAAAAIAAGW